MMLLSVNGLWSSGLSGLKERSKVPFEHAKGLTVGIDMSIAVYKLLKQDLVVMRNTVLSTTSKPTAASVAFRPVVQQLQWELQLLKQHGIRPFPVLDGCTKHPMKQTVAHVARQQARSKARDELNQLYQLALLEEQEAEALLDRDDKHHHNENQNPDETGSTEQQQHQRRWQVVRHWKTLAIPTVDLMRQVVIMLQEELGETGMMVAPFEAEWQLVYLEQQGIIDGMISRDGDCIILGAQRVYTEVDYDQQLFCLYQRNDIIAKLQSPPVMLGAPSHQDDKDDDDKNATTKEEEEEEEDELATQLVSATTTATTQAAASSKEKTVISSPLYLLNGNNVEYWPELAALAGCDYIVSPKGIALGRAIQNVYDKVVLEQSSNPQQHPNNHATIISPQVLVRALAEYCEGRSTKPKTKRKSRKETDNIEMPTATTKDNEQDKPNWDWDAHMERFVQTIHLLRHCPVLDIGHSNDDDNSCGTMTLVPLNPLPLDWKPDQWGHYIGFGVANPGRLLPVPNQKFYAKARLEQDGYSFWSGDKNNNNNRQDEQEAVALGRETTSRRRRSSSSSSRCKVVDDAVKQLDNDRSHGIATKQHRASSVVSPEITGMDVPQQDEDFGKSVLFAHVDFGQHDKNSTIPLSCVPTIALEAFVTARWGIQAARLLGPTTTRSQLESVVRAIVASSSSSSSSSGWPVLTWRQLEQTLEQLGDYLSLSTRTLMRTMNETDTNQTLRNDKLLEKTMENLLPDQDWFNSLAFAPNYTTTTMEGELQDWWYWWTNDTTTSTETNEATNVSAVNESAIVQDPHRTLWLQIAECGNPEKVEVSTVWFSKTQLATATNGSNHPGSGNATPQRRPQFYAPYFETPTEDRIAQIVTTTQQSSSSSNSSSNSLVFLYLLQKLLWVMLKW